MAHPEVASTLNELGTIALAEQRYADAEAAFHRMEEIYRAVFDGKHYLIGTALSNRASVYSAQRQYARAEPLYREAVRIYRETLPAEHTALAIGRIKLCRALLRQGRFAEAERETRAGCDVLKGQASGSINFLRAAREDPAAIYDSLHGPSDAARFRTELAPAFLPERGIASRRPRPFVRSVPGGRAGRMDEQARIGDGGGRIRVLVADDHPVVRTGLAAVIADQPDLELVAEAENGQRAVALFREFEPDVVLMDLRMPVMDGVEAIRAITAEFPSAHILALTTYEGDADIRRALDAGARGYLLKDMLLTDVLTAIRAVGNGDRVIPTAVAVRLAEYPERSTLTERELEVLELVARGRSNKEVADAIGRTDETVKIHLKNIFAKLNVDDRTEAVTVALARGLIHLE